MKLIFNFLLVVLAHIIFVWYSNQPQDVGKDVPAGKLMSLSFAPFREGFSPLEKTKPLPEHIEQDLQLLADKTESIRTYSSSIGLEPIPELAGKYGLKVIQGGWLSSNLIDNRQEMAALIKSANAYPDIVKRVIVGNEVLLRGELDVERVIGYIREVKRAVKQPVSYADVWSIYMRYPQLMNEVDFITIHILPYWEDEPISVDNAAEHLEKIVKQVENEARGVAPGKPILIGESGWPSTGRQRGLAIPSVVNEAKFIRNFIQVVNQHGFDYNIVEAFNQPWKSHLEGVVGANWGLFSAAREAIFPLTGTVYENSHWLEDFFAATGLALVLCLVFYRRLTASSWLHSLLWLAFAQLLSVCLLEMADYLWYTSYNNWQRTYSVFMITINGFLLLLLLQRAAEIVNNQSGNPALAELLRFFYLLLIGIALYHTFGLAVYGRYLSFPVEQFTIAVYGIVGLTIFINLQEKNLKLQNLKFDSLIGWKLHSHRDPVIAYFLSFAFIAMILGETLAFLDGRDFIQAHSGFSTGFPFALKYAVENQQLQQWLLSLLVLSLPFWNNSDEKIKHH